jgi:hypothetical protein
MDFWDTLGGGDGIFSFAKVLFLKNRREGSKCRQKDEFAPDNIRT